MNSLAASTRLVVPRPAVDLVSRPRLLQALTEASSHPLTLLAAPAGAGKSSLLSDWTRAGLAPGPVGWVSLDGGSIDRRKFWALALASAARASDDAALDPGSGSVERRLSAFQKALAARREPLVLVLDDFQAVTDRAAMADLDALLEHPSDLLRVVIASRRDPPLRLSRLRLAAGLVEIRARDLAFTLEEGASFLRRASPSLRVEDAHLLWRRTEGWAAGLRLAARAVRDHPDPSALAADFAGDDSAVADYLLSEVLDRHPPRERETLLRISLVDAVCGELADALAANTGGHRMLRRLAAENAMLEPVEGRPGWFRFHPLLRGLLRTELHARPREEVAGLHRRAACWLAAQGSLKAAVRHALAGGDAGLASAIVARNWAELFPEGELVTLRALVAALPSHALLEQPELALAAAAVHVEDAEHPAAAAALDAAAAGAGSLPPERRRQFDVAHATVLLRRARLHGDLADGLAAARALTGGEIPLETAPGLRALAMASLGIVELWLGQTERAVAHLETACGAAARDGHDYVAALALAHLALQDSFAGRHRRAYDRAREAADLVEGGGWTGSSAAAAAYAVLAGIHYLWDEADAARRALDRASEALHAAPERTLRALATTNEVRVLAMQGKLDAAHGLLRFERLALGDLRHGYLAAILDAQEGLLLNALGDREEARRFLEDVMDRRDSPEVRVALARLRLSDGDPQATQELVRPIRARNDAEWLVTTRVQAHALAALAHDALAEHDAAAVAIEQALHFAEPRGLRRVLLELGPAMRPVLRRQIRRTTAHRALVAELLDALEQGTPGESKAQQPIDPLTEREVTILRYLPTMLSNREIAGELFLSVNTVKTHLRQLYRKLDVPNRRAAVDRGRSLGLLAPSRGDP